MAAVAPASMQMLREARRGAGALGSVLLSGHGGALDVGGLTQKSLKRNFGVRRW